MTSGASSADRPHIPPLDLTKVGVVPKLDLAKVKEVKGDKLSPVIQRTREGRNEAAKKTEHAVKSAPPSKPPTKKNIGKAKKLPALNLPPSAIKGGEVAKQAEIVKPSVPQQAKGPPKPAKTQGPPPKMSLNLGGVPPKGPMSLNLGGIPPKASEPARSEAPESPAGEPNIRHIPGTDTYEVKKEDGSTMLVRQGNQLGKGQYNVVYNTQVFNEKTQKWEDSDFVMAVAKADVNSTQKMNSNKAEYAAAGFPQMEHVMKPEAAHLERLPDGSTNLVRIMKKMSGGEASDLRDKELGGEVLKEVARQMAVGINNLHSNNIVHRDLKGQNAMLQSPINKDSKPSDVHVEIIDFGTHSKIEEGKELAALTTEGTKTHTAPEIFGIESLDKDSGTIRGNTYGHRMAREALYGDDGKIDPTKVPDFLKRTEVYAYSVGTFELWFGEMPPLSKEIAKMGDAATMVGLTSHRDSDLEKKRAMLSNLTDEQISNIKNSDGPFTESAATVQAVRGMSDEDIATIRAGGDPVRNKYQKIAEEKGISQADFDLVWNGLSGNPAERPTMEEFTHLGEKGQTVLTRR